MNEQEIDVARKKLQHPPKFFAKIHKIISQKRLIIEVFLSLLDKNNTQMVTNDDLFKIFKDSSLLINKKYIENAIRLMGCTNKHIPLSKIEEWYDRYDYLEDVESSSSDEEMQQSKNFTSSLSCSNIVINERVINSFKAHEYHKTAEDNVLICSEVSNLS